MTLPPAEEIAAYLAQEDALMVVDVAKHAGDKIHSIIKMHAMTMPSAASAISLGVLVARQILEETMEFAARTVGDPAEADQMRDAIRLLFDGTAHLAGLPGKSDG